MYVKPKIILEELEEKLKEIPIPDVLTITANGEPTLYTYLDELIDGVNRIKKSAKSLILSNSSTISDLVIRENLKKLDIVKLSLDSVEDSVFKKIDRGMSGIKISNIIDGIIDFRGEYQGELILEILLVKGVNDHISNAKEFKKYLEMIKPDRIDISTIHRPPAYDVNSVGFEYMERFAEEIGEFNIFLASNQHVDTQNRMISKDEFLNTIAKRPLTKYDIKTLFGDKTLQLAESMSENNEISKKSVGNIEFFTKKS